MKHGATPAEPNAPVNLANIGAQDPDVSILKCTNPAEAIAYEKNLRKLAETALKKLQEDPDTEGGNEDLDTVMPQLIRDFKDAFSEMYQPVEKLLHSHACMLELQGQVSMLLGKLATSVSPKTYLALLNATVKPMHQVMLPETVKTHLTPPEIPKKVKQTVAIADKVTPNPEYMKRWADNSATLYLAATL